MAREDIISELKKPLDASAIRPPAPGKYGEYVDGKHVIDEANRIFGHDGWSYAVTRLEQVSEQTVSTPKGDQYRVGYLCAVRVTIHALDNASREGVAVGSGVGKPETMADHHESAVKEAETDALKRALRSFGNTFGLALYEKDKAKREVADPNAHKALSDNLMKAVNGAANGEALANILRHPNFKADLERLRGMNEEAAAHIEARAEQRTRDMKEAT